MSRLFKLAPGQDAAALKELPFAHEVADLEETLWTNPSVLGDGVQMVARQLDTGVGGRIDILAVERSGTAAQVVIIELKNVEAGPDVLLQALRYASWARSNPDSTRLHLLAAKVKLDPVDYSPKLIIIAPAIRPEVLELSQYVTAFTFEFLTIKRFEAGGEHLVLLDPVTPPAPAGTASRSQEEWGWEKLQTEMKYSQAQMQLARQIHAALEDLIGERGWNLTPRFRKGYVPFQYGGRNLAYIHWPMAGHVGIGIRLNQPPSELGIPLPDGAKTKYSPVYKDFQVYIPVSSSFSAADYEPLLELAYADLAGG